MDKYLITVEPLPKECGTYAKAGEGLLRVVYSLIVINKAGGLVYQREFNEGLQKISTNDYLVLAGTFHGVHAISRSLTPRVHGQNGGNALPNPSLPISGIENLETATFRLTCFQTLTGTKFLLITDTLTPNTDVIMKGVYERYADYVMKNPFYQLEMPIRVEAWERALTSWLKSR
ncbi:MAG: hypothetical protein Q9227_004177 [Pyrenula ochraceoflavens]